MQDVQWRIIPHDSVLHKAITYFCMHFSTQYASSSQSLFRLDFCKRPLSYDKYEFHTICCFQKLKAKCKGKSSSLSFTCNERKHYMILKEDPFPLFALKSIATYHFSSWKLPWNSVPAAPEKQHKQPWNPHLTALPKLRVMWTRNLQQYLMNQPATDNLKQLTLCLWLALL